MKRHTAFLSLSREHHDALLLAARLSQGKTALLHQWSHDLNWQAEYVVKFFDTSLEFHFNIEEAAVFPPAAQYFDSDSKIIVNLLEEHRIMRQKIERFRSERSKNLGSDLKILAELLEKHIRTEEREFFPACEEMMPADKLEETGRQIRNLRKGAST